MHLSLSLCTLVSHGFIKVNKDGPINGLKLGGQSVYFNRVTSSLTAFCPTSSMNYVIVTITSQIEFRRCSEWLLVSISMGHEGSSKRNKFGENTAGKYVTVNGSIHRF